MKDKFWPLTDPKTGSPVLDTWALVAQAEKLGLDARGELERISGVTCQTKVDPPTRISAEGFPVITREEVQGMNPQEVGICFFNGIQSVVLTKDVELRQCEERVRQMPQSWRLVFTICSLQSDVDSGGFELFFYGAGRGRLVDETEADLRFIGADTFCELFIAAREFCQTASPDCDEAIPEVSDLDTRFFEQPKPLFALVGEHILSHLAAYCHE